jgi:hypothetical protein
VNLAGLEHKLAHLERDLRRTGLLREREPEAGPELSVLLEAATDDELARLEEAAETDDDAGQAQTLAGIARRLDEERPALAARSPLQAAVAVERARRRGDLDVETLVSVLSVQEIEALCEALSEGRLVAGGTELEGEALTVVQGLQERARRRFARWSRSRSGLTTHTARATRANAMRQERRAAAIAELTKRAGLAVPIQNAATFFRAEALERLAVFVDQAGSVRGASFLREGSYDCRDGDAEGVDHGRDRAEEPVSAGRPS